MRFVSWNIRHGGKRAEIERIMAAIKRYDADVNLLVEYRANDSGRRLRDELGQLQWPHQHCSSPAVRQNGLLVLSKHPLELSSARYRRPRAAHRWLDLRFPQQQLSLIGVHIPNYNERWNKRNFWDTVVRRAKALRAEDCLILGDYNTGLAIDTEGMAFKMGDYMERLLSLGWVDAWRQMHGGRREYTWYSSAGNGFRLDYAFLSPSLAQRLVTACHSHQERLDGLSDHSILILDIAEKSNFVHR